MKWILQEEKVAQEILENKEIYNDNVNKTMELLIKYWHSQSLSIDQIKDRLEKFLQDNYKDYNVVKWQRRVNDNVKRIVKNNYPLIQIDTINITKSELNYIRKLDNIILEKIAFVMLVHCKIESKIRNENNDWIKSDNSIFVDAKVNERYKTRLLYINQLQDCGAVTITQKVDGEGIKINYIEENSKVEMVITDFREFVLEYLKWRGENIGSCVECGCRIEITTSNNKYCKECAKYIKNEQNKKYYNNLGKRTNPSSPVLD